MRIACFLLVLLLHSSAHSQMGPVTAWCDCLQKEYAEFGLDLMGQRNAFFQTLITEGVVDSFDGESIRKMLLNVPGTGQFPESAEGLWDSLESVNTTKVNRPLAICAEQMEAIADHPSFDRPKVRWDSVESRKELARSKGHEFGVREWCMALGAELSISDLESELFRTHFYIMWSKVTYKGHGVHQEIYPTKPKYRMVDREETFTVFISSRNELIVEGESIEIHQLKEKCKNWRTCQGVFEESGSGENCAPREWLEVEVVDRRIGDLKRKLVETKPDYKVGVEGQLMLQNRYKDAIQYFGPFNRLAPNVIISMQLTNAPSDSLPDLVYQEVEAACDELINETCWEHFGMSYQELSTLAEVDAEAQRKLYAVRVVHPRRISEALARGATEYD